MLVEEHYERLLGINSPWEISRVDLNIEAQRVDIVIEHTNEGGFCPKCGADCPKHDNRQERTWRHLDTMQFVTSLRCELPRVRCKDHDVLTVTAPWAGKSRRFTLLFEAFAIRVLQASRSVEEARKLLNLNWHQVEAIKARAVKRGLKRREANAIDYLGIDEKQFRSGHRYISSLVDLREGRVLEVVEERTEEACKTLISQSLTPLQQGQVVAVALDMWKAYANAVTEKLPQADLVHDRFHISQHLNNAVDIIRRKENKELMGQGDQRLKGSKFLWLTNEENQKERYADKFSELKSSGLRVSRAWSIKELFRGFWDCTDADEAKQYFDRWYSWAIRSRLASIKEKARMIKNHLGNILTYFSHGITNAVSEGLNSKIQLVKSNARGYRSFDGFRNSILFYCGGLNMVP